MNDSRIEAYPGIVVLSRPFSAYPSLEGSGTMRRIVWALALVILLSGCGAQEEAASSVETTEALLVIDGAEVPAWRYLCWLDRTLAALGPEASAEDLAEAKAQALSDTALYAAVEAMAAEQGIALSEEERAALTPGVWGDLPEDQWRELAAVGALYGRLCAMEVSQETLAEFGAHRGYRTIDRILIPTGEGAAEKAAEVFAALNGGGEAAFSAAKAQSADTLGPRTLLPGDGTLDAALDAAAGTLAEGQLSGILESEEGFSILYCLPLDTEQMRIPWLDDQLQARADGAEIQALSGYESLDISGRYRQICGQNVESGQSASSS